VPDEGGIAVALDSIETSGGTRWPISGSAAPPSGAAGAGFYGRGKRYVTAWAYEPARFLYSMRKGPGSMFEPDGTTYQSLLYTFCPRLPSS
jgi:hypothetical protein